MLVERITPYGFYGAVGFHGVVVFAPSSGQSEVDPIGGLIAGPPETLGVHESLEKIQGMAVNLLPVGGNPSGHVGEQVRGEMGHTNPWKYKESAVVGWGGENHG